MTSSSASTSKNYVHVPQFQVMTIAPSTGETKPTSSNKKSSKSNVEEAGSPPIQQHVQLITMDHNSLVDNCGQYVMQVKRGKSNV